MFDRLRKEIPSSVDLRVRAPLPLIIVVMPNGFYGPKFKLGLLRDVLTLRISATLRVMVFSILKRGCHHSFLFMIISALHRLTV